MDDDDTLNYWREQWMDVAHTPPLRRSYGDGPPSPLPSFTWRLPEWPKLRRTRTVVAVSHVMPHMFGSLPPYAETVVEQWTRQVLQAPQRCAPRRDADAADGDMTVFVLDDDGDTWRETAQRIEQACATFLQELGREPTDLARAQLDSFIVVDCGSGGGMTALKWDPAAKCVMATPAASAPMRELHDRIIRHLINWSNEDDYAFIDVRGVSFDVTTRLAYAIALGGLSRRRAAVGVMLFCIVRHDDALYLNVRALARVMYKAAASGRQDLRNTPMFEVLFMCVYLSRLALLMRGTGSPATMLAHLMNAWRLGLDAVQVRLLTEERLEWTRVAPDVSRAAYLMAGGVTAPEEVVGAARDTVLYPRSAAKLNPQPAMQFDAHVAAELAACQSTARLLLGWHGAQPPQIDLAHYHALQQRQQAAEIDVGMARPAATPSSVITLRPPSIF